MTSSAILASSIFLQFTLRALAAADITLNSVSVSSGFSLYSVPASIVISTTHTTADSTGPIVYQFDQFLFMAGSQPACSATLSSGSASFTCTAGNPFSITAALASGSVGAGVTVTLTISASTPGNIVAFPSVATTFKMLSVTANAGGNTLNGGAVDVFRVVSVPTVTLTATDLNAGTTPSSLQVQFNSPLALATGQTLVVTGSLPIFTALRTSGLTDPSSIFASYITTSVSVFTGTLGSNVALDAAVDFSFTTTMMAPFPLVANFVTLDIAGNGHPLFKAARGFGSAGGVGGVVGDPVTWYGDVRTEFNLPMGEHSVLLQTPDMLVVAWPFEGRAEDQWIGKVLVASHTGDTVVEVEVKRNLTNFNRTKTGPDTFETLDIAVGPTDSPSRLTHIPSFDDQINHPQGFITKFSRISAWTPTGPACLQLEWTPCRENVIVLSKYAKIFIESSSAVEYHGSSRETMDFTHLDVQVADMTSPQSFQGVLPELWGLRPMSKRTQAMIKSQTYVDTGLNKTTAWMKSDTNAELPGRSSQDAVTV
eukprot:TRINITY_DN90863_c0_g1_i1.p1 TRINITY_DN90863_c0_g1~~TRINITY_DN90863_c0_g1_i1.p1  ORF type:complete len:538 (-),score=53.92 TRINITY_DN90863_c0_g1_i1:64-1677(-)